MKYFLLTLITILHSSILIAQKEGSVWYFGSGNGVDFSRNPPQLINNAPITADRFATIADLDGNLVFYCNYNTVWNAQHQVMENGTELEGHLFTDIIILKRPESASQYYIFQVSPHEVSKGVFNKVIYSLVDISANEGAGRVIEKNIVLYSNLHGHFTISGSCETGYWLVGETNTNIVDSIGTDLIYAFKIDGNKVSHTPVVSEPVIKRDGELLSGIGNSWGYQFSPDGKKLFFGYEGNGPRGAVVADFDLETGKVSKLLKVGDCCASDAEFSADGNYIYVSKGNLYDSELTQYDLRNPNQKLRNYPGILLTRLPHTAKLQLAPDGKIYINSNPTLGVIHHPELHGLDCELEMGNILQLPHEWEVHYLPKFATHLLYQQPDKVDAGPDVEVCSGESIQIGGANSPLKNYEWFPKEFLDNPFTSNPVFKYDNPYDSTVTFFYKIKSCDEDLLKIDVHPKPRPTIDGSRSVCPGVELVAYWTEYHDDYTYEWSVDGGDIVSGLDTDSILINWGATNPAAKVGLVSYSEKNCPSDTITFPVRINVELQPETPVGDSLLCANLASEIPYMVTNTNGSIYNWQSDFGTLVNGQGSNQITIDWPEDGSYHLWVLEHSITIDTVCDGISDSLKVNIFTDTTKIEIDFASVRSDDTGTYELQWFANDTARIAGDFELYTLPDYSSSWGHLHMSNKNEHYFAYKDTLMDHMPLSFKISSMNGCQQVIESDVHTTIYLEGVTDSSSYRMDLQWTPYVGWESNIEQYELWYAKEDESQLLPVATFNTYQLNWSNNWGTKAFDHYFRIRAIHATFPFESWSNKITFSFNHDIEIPNVFTPNNDGINDTFFITNLELFHQNELCVYNRYGTEVFSKINYDGGWTGGDLASGVYYYFFTVERTNKSYKGWVQILK